MSSFPSVLQFDPAGEALGSEGSPFYAATGQGGPGGPGGGNVFGSDPLNFIWNFFKDVSNNNALNAYIRDQEAKATRERDRVEEAGDTALLGQDFVTQREMTAADRERIRKEIELQWGPTTNSTYNAVQDEIAARFRQEQGLPREAPPPGANELAVDLSQESKDFSDNSGALFQETVDPEGLLGDLRTREATGRTDTDRISAFAKTRFDDNAVAGAGVQEGFSNRTAEAKAAMQQLVAGYQQRLTQGMGILQTAGLQERTDINQQFDRFGGGAAISAASRGVRGTLAAGIQTGIERTRADALGGAADRLTRQRSDVFSQLSGDALTAQLTAIGTQMGLSGEELNNLVRQMRDQSGLSSDQLGVLQDNATFNADLSGQTITAQGQLGAANLASQTNAFQNDLNNRYVFGQLPIATGLETQRRLTDLNVNGIQNLPPALL